MKRNACDLKEYVDLKTFQTVEANIQYALDNITIEGNCVEFGVFKGRSLKIIADHNAPKKVYGFDSFEGLPHDWEVSDGNVYEKGRFSLEGKLPEVPENAELVVGWFNETLEGWLKDHQESLAFVHVDSDLYSSAKYILTTLNDYIKVGTIILFDELLNFESGVGVDYEFWSEGEWKAMNEWMQEFDRELVPISRDISTRVAMKVVK
jgi:hypothetical protein